MGWEVSLFMRFDTDTDVWSRYLRLIEQLSGTPEQFRVKKISGFNSSVVSKFRILEEEFAADTLERVRGLLANLDQDRLILQTDIGVFRESRSAEDRTVEPIRTSLFVRGAQASWRPTRDAERLNLIWHMGDFKNYHPSVAEFAWEANWNRLLDEVEVIAELADIAEIWGGQESFDGKPEHAFLTYQRADASLAAICDAMPDKLSARKLGGGVLIYSKEGIKGSLDRSLH